MSLDVKLLKTGQFVYHCETEDDLISFLKEIKEANIGLPSWTIIFDKNLGFRFEECSNSLIWGDIRDYKRLKYPIIEYNKGAITMNIKDLKTGMVVETREGFLYQVLILDDGFVLQQYSYKSSCYLHSSLYRNDLTHSEDKEKDIVKVYNVSVQGFFNIPNYKDDLVWERSEVDWSKVEVDTKIYVRNEGEKWYPRYFKEYSNGKIRAFEYGATSFSANDCSTIWEYAKLAE